MRLEALQRRFNTAKSDWANWRTLYEEAYAYTMPERNPWPDEIIDGAKRNIGVYDTTAISSARRLVARLHKALLPPGSQWFWLEAGPAVPIDSPQRKALDLSLAQAKNIIDRAIDESNFDLIANELLQDLIVGTGAMMVLENDSDQQPFRCKSVPLNRIYPEGDAFDDINTVFLEIPRMSGEDILPFWPKAKIPADMQRRMNEDPSATFDMSEAVVFDPKKKIYQHAVWADGISEIVMDIETKSTPWIISRWSKNSLEVGGRGPVIDALPTIRSVNKLVEFILTNVGLSTNPPWLAASDGVFNPYMFSIEPNKVIPISRQSMGQLPLQKLDVSGDIQMGTLEVNDMRNQIKDLLFDSPVSPEVDPRQTATLTMLQHLNWLETIGPAFGRLSIELMPKVIKRIVFILQKRGLLPKEFKIDNKIVTIRYKSPLEKGRDLEAVQNLQQYLQFIINTLGPEVATASLDLTILPQWLGNKLSVDPKLIKAPADVANAIKMIQQAQNPPSPADQQPPAQQPAENAAAQAQVNPAQAQQQPQGQPQ